MSAGTVAMASVISGVPAGGAAPASPATAAGTTTMHPMLLDVRLTASAMKLAHCS